MAKMTMGSTRTQIEVEAGRYVCRFTGTEDREPFKESKFGNAGGPRMGWLFEVAEGPQKGKKISQESGCAAVPRSTAARMLAGLVGRALAVGESVDTDALVGKLYSVKVGPNPDSDKGNLYIADLEPVQGGGAPTPASAAAPGKPPARKPVAPTHLVRKFWAAFNDEGEAVLTTGAEIQEYIHGHNLDVRSVELCLEGSEEWKPAESFGFTGKPAY